MDCSNIQLKNIKFLSGKNFFIPDYQRGYRWTSTEVSKMLDDFLEFLNRKKRRTLATGEFYCLQPIVVKGREDLGPDWYEVIDGQQRLTTLYLILSALSKSMPLEKFKFKPYHIVYQTRQSNLDDDLLAMVGTDEFNESATVDSFYMDIVYQTINKWLKSDHNFGGFLEYDLMSLMLDEIQDKTKDGHVRDIANNIRIIWYDVKEKKNENSIAIFTRLNVGKIPLTNAELIKALFLKKNNLIEQSLSDKEKEAKENELTLRQILIAEEWAQIEQRLQEDAFWYFLQRSDSLTKYETRIEFIFDLMSDKESEEDPKFYHTFNFFNDRFSEDSKDQQIEKEWNGVKKYFRELEYWYNDRRLFHLIGFLIEIGVKVKDIMNLAYERSEENPHEFVLDEYGEKVRLNKDIFLVKIENRIREYMSNVDIDKLMFDDKNNKMRHTLLLFNILTVADSDRSDIKFPFDKYKTESWDKEHIASRTDHDETPRTHSQRRQWIDDMLLYFCGAEDGNDESDENASLKNAKKWLDSHIANHNKENRDENVAIVEDLIRAKEMSMMTDKERDSNEYENLMESLYKSLQRYFNSDKLSEEKKDTIGNMALLNSSINRSYHNALFPIKRMHIKNNDSLGVFIPIATKNVFLKYYSNSIDNMMYWTDEDAESYVKSIKHTLRKYIKH